MRSFLILPVLSLVACDKEPVDTGSTAQPSGCTASSIELAACTDGQAYQDDLAFIAQERTPGSDHWQAVQDLCAQRFAQLGLEVELNDYGSGVNVIGRQLGETAPDEQILITAHYDHITGCDGADDNASGVAGVLESARLLSQVRFERSLVYACWDEEERGLIGSEHWAEEAAARGDIVITVFNYEMIGFLDDTPGAQSFPTGLDLLFPEAYEQAEENEFRGDFLAVVGDEASHDAIEAMEDHAEIVGLPLLTLELTSEQTTSAWLSDLQRSDHASFWYEGYPAMMLTDTSEFRYSAYHCSDGDDVVENLDQDFARRNIATTTGAAADIAGWIGAAQ